MKREGRLGLGIGLGLRRERTSSFLSGMAGCQMLKAGLAQDESDDDEDGTSGAEVGLDGESGSGRASSNASGLDSGVDVPGSEARGSSGTTATAGTRTTGQEECSQGQEA